MAGPATQGRGAAAAAAIRYHYDVGNEFYALWLDRSLTYSCAMPEHRTDTLEAAQRRKLRYHADAVRPACPGQANRTTGCSTSAAAGDRCWRCCRRAAGCGGRPA